MGPTTLAVCFTRCKIACLESLAGRFEHGHMCNSVSQQSLYIVFCLIVARSPSDPCCFISHFDFTLRDRWVTPMLNRLPHGQFLTARQAPPRTASAKVKSFTVTRPILPTRPSVVPRCHPLSMMEWAI